MSVICIVLVASILSDAWEAIERRINERYARVKFYRPRQYKFN